MSGSATLLHLAGSIALLLWATRMVRTGMERGFGDAMRRRLRGTLDRPLAAMLAGLGMAVALQSSTAVTLLVGSFAGSGVVTGTAGLLAVRGAELGSALVVKLLTFDLSLLAPAALVLGTVLFMATARREWRLAGRAVVGVGLVVLSLSMMGEATAPLRESPILPTVVGAIAGDPIVAFLLAAIVTYLLHSSIAAMLLLANLAAHGVVAPEIAVVMVLGVNLGSSLIAPLLTRAAPRQTRVVPLGNLLMRGLGSLAALVLFLALRPAPTLFGTGPADQAVNLHILFNAAVLVVGLPLSGVVERAVNALLAPGRGASADEPAEVSALDESVVSVPALALANATRETVRACETVEVMLGRLAGLYARPEAEGIAALRKLDDRLDRRHAAIKLYLAKLSGHPMSEAEAARCAELIDGCVKLEQVGDIVVRNLLAHAEKLVSRHLAFTPEGQAELADMQAAVLANARLAFNVLIARDAETARHLVAEKDRLRELERRSSQRHFSRLGAGSAASLATSAIHLDTMRDLKQVNSLLASLAYPVLEEQGLLRRSRLRVAK